jgi:transposase
MKIHAIVDGLGNPIRFELTTENSYDCVKEYEMLQEIDLAGKTVIADRGYDMNNILELIARQQAIAVIPSHKHRKFSANAIGGCTKNVILWNICSTSLNITADWLRVTIN